jgi:SAM-dependent methyltransferase
MSTARSNQKKTKKNDGDPSSYEIHPLVWKLFPQPTDLERQTARVRAEEHGQTGVIEAVEGQITSGFLEFEALKEAGKRIDVGEIPAPSTDAELHDRIVCGNLPALQLDQLARGILAILAYKPFAKHLARERMADGGRKKGKGCKTVEHPSSDTQTKRQGKKKPARWYMQPAARVGITPNFLASLDAIHEKSADVFDALASRKIPTLADARRLIDNLPDDEDRAAVVKRYTESKKEKPMHGMIYDLRREKLHEARPVGIPKGQGYEVRHGDVAKMSESIPAESVEAIIFDPPYASTQEGYSEELIDRGVQIAKRILVPGGVLVFFSGNRHWYEHAKIAAAHLTPLPALGHLHYRNGGAGGRGYGQRVTTRLNSEPLLFFSNRPAPAEKLTHTGFETETMPDEDKQHHAWEKPSDSALSIIRSVARPKSVVVDLCCGGGPFSEAALLHGCQVISIDSSKTACEATASRLAAAAKLMTQKPEADAVALSAELREQRKGLAEQVKTGEAPKAATVAKLKKGAANPKKGRGVVKTNGSPTTEVRGIA